MSDNPLVPQDLTAGPLATPGALGTLLSGGDYLGRLQLFGAKSDAVSEDKIPMNHYGLVRDQQIEDLGKEIDIIIITWRSKAVQSGEDFIVCYTPDFEDGKVTNETFRSIMQKSGIRDSGCMYGPEFLVWIPSAGVFATLHMNSKTSRREAKNLEPLIGCGTTLKSRLIDPPNSKYKWQGIVVIPCSSPLDMPSEEQMREEYAKFHNPPENEVVVVPNEERAR